MLTQEVIDNSKKVIDFCIEHKVMTLDTAFTYNKPIYGMFITTVTFQAHKIYDICTSKDDFNTRKSIIKELILNDGNITSCVIIICNHELNIHTPTDFYQECIDSIK